MRTEGGRDRHEQGGEGGGGPGASRRVRTEGGGYSRQAEAEAAMSKEDQLAYSKKARPVEYVPYSGRDYKAQFGGDAYYELGKLGPDLDQGELAAKRERQERMRAFAEGVRHENRQQVAQAPEKRDKPKPPSTRQKAMEFAKNVPKPKVKPQVREEVQESDGSDEEGELTELQLLALRHQRDKELVEQIRRDMRINRD